MAKRIVLVFDPADADEDEDFNIDNFAALLNWDMARSTGAYQGYRIEEES